MIPTLKVNHGHGLNISTGVFTAPIAGVYAFHFHALTRDGTATYIKIMHNGRNIGGAYRRHEGEADENHESLRVSPVMIIEFDMCYTVNTWARKF